MKEEKDSLVLITISSDGSIFFIRDNDISKDQEKALRNISLCFDKPSVVLKTVLFLENILRNIESKFLKK